MDHSMIGWNNVLCQSTYAWTVSRHGPICAIRDHFSIIDRRDSGVLNEVVEWYLHCGVVVI